MAQTEEIETTIAPSRGANLRRLATIFFLPARTLRGIMAEERAVWLAPMLLLTVLTLIIALVGGPIRQQAAQQGVEPPENFQYMSPEQQEQYMQAQQSGQNFVTTSVFPAVGALSSLWLSWFLLGGVLHLSMTLLGSRSSTRSAYNLAAWASMPFAIRLVVTLIALIANQKIASAPGVSGFIAADAGGFLLYLRALLAMVDLYLIWQIVLLTIGAAVTPGLTRSKAFAGVIITVLLVVGLGALPGFLLGQLGGLDIQRSFFFF